MNRDISVHLIIAAAPSQILDCTDSYLSIHIYSSPLLPRMVLSLLNMFYRRFLLYSY
jgi:hypothetical protein